MCAAMTRCMLCREDSDPRYITHAADVKLRSFTTKVSLLMAAEAQTCTLLFLACGHPVSMRHPCVLAVYMQVHKIDTLVSYRAEIED